MHTEELVQFYRSIHVPDDSVRHVLDGLPNSNVKSNRFGFQPPRTQVFALTAVVLIILIGSLGYLSVHGDDDRHTPAGHSSALSAPATPTPTPTATATPTPTPTLRVVLPTKRSDTVSGAVVSNGRPLSNAYVNVLLLPNGSIQDSLKNGQKLPTKNLPTVRTDEHGGFVVRLDKSDIVDRRFRESDFINFEIDVSTVNHMATWNGTFEIRHDTTTPIQIIIDFGAKTIDVNGAKSTLPIF